MAVSTFSLPGPNPALHTNEKHEIYMRESPELKPGPYDCVVHVRANGICGYGSVLTGRWGIFLLMSR